MINLNELEKNDQALFPAFEYNNIPIVLVSSEYYVPYVSVLIESIKKYSSKDNNYDIIIFHSSIHKDFQNRIKDSVTEYNNISIRFFNASNRMDTSNLFVAAKYYSIEAYYRILTPWILHNYDKAIVMDSDLILLCDIANLFNINISDFSLGAVKDIAYQGFLNGAVSGTLEYAKSVLKLRNPYNYVNTGVLLMNLKKIRNNTSEYELVSFCKNHHFNIQEQDGLNVFFDGDIKPINLKWNYYVEVNPLIKTAIESAPEDAKNKYRNIDKYSLNNASPFIIHYANQPKPWDDPNGKYAEIWWEIAQKSSFYPIILYRMMQSICNSYQPVMKDKPMSLNVQISFARKVADKFFPKGSSRRRALKKVIPKNSPQWNLLKKIYHIFSFH